MQYLDEEATEPEVTHYYLAQIAAEVRRVLSKNPNKIKLRDFILRRRNSKLTEAQKKQKMEESKRFWFAVTKTKPPEH